LAFTGGSKKKEKRISRLSTTDLLEMQQTILIVGGTSGLGRRLAELYYGDGYKIAVIGRRQHLLSTLQQRFPDIQTLQYDISQPDCKETIDSFIQKLGGIDKIILSASIVRFNPSLNLEKEKETLRINIEGYITVLNCAYKHFSAKNYGHIIGITSIAAARGNKTAIAYNASKAFQSSYIEGLRLKAIEDNKNISVTELIPGYMATSMAKGERLFWVAPLDKAARQSKKAIDKKKSRAFITKRWKYIYLIYKYLPSSVYSYLINSKIKLQKRD
jgi:short-subunit dehydrogenase